MRALLLGSIGTLIESSELQRRAFNLAFDERALGWHWDQATYRDLLRQSGGRKRIEGYAAKRGSTVDAEATHRRKTELFQEMLRKADLPFRDGALGLLAAARDVGLRLGFVSGTSADTVTRIVSALADHGLESGRAGPPFDVVTSDALGLSPKPAPSLYTHALDQLGVLPSSALAIEDNAEGVKAARAAGLYTVAFPGANTQMRDIQNADEVVMGNIYDAFKLRLVGPLAAAE